MYCVYGTAVINLIAMVGGGGSYPIYFLFSQKDCMYRIQIWHAFNTDKMSSDQHLNEDIDAKLDIEICKKLFVLPITGKGGSINLRKSFDILIEGRGISPTPVTPYSD